MIPSEEEIKFSSKKQICNEEKDGHESEFNYSDDNSDNDDWSCKYIRW